MSYSTFCVQRDGKIIDSPRNIGLIRLKPIIGDPHEYARWPQVGWTGPKSNRPVCGVRGMRGARGVEGTR